MPFFWSKLYEPFKTSNILDIHSQNIVPTICFFFFYFQALLFSYLSLFFLVCVRMLTTSNDTKFISIINWRSRSITRNTTQGGGRRNPTQTRTHMTPLFFPILNIIHNDSSYMFKAL